MTQAVADQIRAERAAARLTQREVWTRAGLTRSTYLRIEDAERDINTAQLAALAPVFGLTLTQLVERAETRHRRGTPSHGGRAAGARRNAEA